MKLIAEWKQWWKMATVYVYLAIGILPQALTLFPESFRGSLPAWLINSVSVAAFIGIVLRLVQQSSIKKDTLG